MTRLTGKRGRVLLLFGWASEAAASVFPVALELGIPSIRGRLLRPILHRSHRILDLTLFVGFKPRPLFVDDLVERG